MFRVMLQAQWKWCRLVIAAGVCAGATLPLLALHEVLSPAELLARVRGWGTVYPVLAAAMGLLTAISAWAPDHRGRHVHALTLPIPRRRYVLLKYLAGLVLLAAPILAVLVGAFVATALATIPDGLHSYPVALTIRFALAVAVAYSIFFAISGATARTAGYIIGVLSAAVAVQVIANAAGIPLRLDILVELAVFQWPGPLAIFTGHWMLIDV
ncbi:MAG TPA: ABC-2 transporter permease [Gemmatimonadales bacterium]|nr:ABC-2 transporter permease [Gemmatimonadales bacterium]